MRQVAIVGAGVAGAGAAYALRDTAAVTVFEKRRSVSGRTATRKRHGCRYDHGANYFKDEDSEVAELVTETLDTDGLVDIDAPVWTFDGAGEISEGHDTDEHKWTYRGGISQLVERLFERTNVSVETDTRVGAIERTDGWRLEDTDGHDLGSYDALVLTPPAPQTADLLARTEWTEDLKGDLEDAIRTVPFRTTVSIVLHYPFELDRPYYALVNTDKNHDVGWLSREDCKPGHVPAGESLLVVQMSSEWSNARYNEPPEAVADAAAETTATLLDDDRLAAPDWTDCQGWRLAQPESGVDSGVLARAKNFGLFFAGDWVVGEGRVHLALRSGLDVGERIIDGLSL
ncbi:MAG TPA: FAD-dependent oxidoreductase [Halococcus sp.]|nr:FAD-dependent oxidoreductase [Halococcus sp.]